MKYWHTVLRARRSLVLVVLVASIVANAQQPAAPPQPAQAMALPTVRDLKVVPLAGDGEMNDLEGKVMAPLVVEVLDPNGRPVEAADVVFRFPLKGPGAFFAGEKTSQRVRTNAQGQAAAIGWLANNEVGTFDVHVTATYSNEMGEATLSMSNVTRIVDDVKKKKKGQNASFWSSRTFKILAVAGGAALVTGIVLATRGSGTPGATPSSTPPTITITPGPPTVGGPH